MTTQAHETGLVQPCCTNAPTGKGVATAVGIFLVLARRSRFEPDRRAVPVAP